MGFHSVSGMVRRIIPLSDLNPMVKPVSSCKMAVNSASSGDFAM
jgi:hypothetical protein